MCALNPASRRVSHRHGRRSFLDRYHSRRVGQRVTGWTVSCASTAMVIGLQSLPALPPRRATSCRALVDHVPDHPAQWEEQPAQPRKAPALASALRTTGGEQAHQQPDRRRQLAKRPDVRSTHPSTLPSPGGRRRPEHPGKFRSFPCAVGRLLPANGTRLVAPGLTSPGWRPLPDRTPGPGPGPGLGRGRLRGT